MKIKSSKGEILTVPDGMEEAAFKAQSEGRLSEFADQIKQTMKSGGMIKRKDGSYSKRGLWDNIRANKGSGRKPTKEMLKQEAKIRAEHADGGVVTDWTPGEAVPWHTSTIGEKMGKGGYTVKRSSARKGKTHVVIGPDGTKKYFGDSKLGQHPGDPKRKKAFYARHAKNLKGNPYFRAFARATWADGGKLGQGIYDMGLMPYEDGGYTMGNMNPDGTIHIPYGYASPAYNERYDFGGWVSDAGKLGLNTLAASLEQISGNNFVNFKYDNKAMADAAAVSEGVIGAGTDIAGSILAGPAYGMVKGQVSGITSKIGHSQEGQRGADKWANQTGQIASSAGNLASGIMSGNAQQIVGGAGQLLGTTGQQLGSKELAGVGQLAGVGAQFVNPTAGGGNSFFKMPTPQMGSPIGNMMAMYGGAIRMDDGGQTGMVPINVEGANFSQGSGPDAKKGELLVKNGKIVKNYVGRPPHPVEGQNPMGDDEAPQGLIVIPKNRTAEYLEAGSEKRKQIEISLISQQQDREMKKMKRPSKKMGDGGYYSFGMGDMGMAHGGMAYSDQLGGHDFAAYGGPIGNPEHIDSLMGYGYKKGGWIQKATASIKRRGTEGVCTGSKFGSSSCPPGSRRYNLAKTFRKMAKHEYGGMVDPVTGSHNLLYAEGGQLPESLLRTRMKASGASEQEINNYVAARYEMGGATNVTHDFPIRRLRYDENSVTGGPNLTGSGPFTASAPYTTMGPPTYQNWAGQQSNITAPGFDGSGNYTANLGKLGPAATPSYVNHNYGNMTQDLAGLAPVLYNFGRGIFEKPYHMNAEEYMSPEMKFESTKFSEEPFRQATSRALYNNQMGLAGRAATAAQMAQARAGSMQDWRNKEATRRQSANQINADIAARNRAMKLQVDVMNQQAMGQRGEFFREGTEQLAQNFGRNPMYYQAMMGKFRQPFTGWETPTTTTKTARKGGRIYR